MSYKFINQNYRNILKPKSEEEILDIIEKSGMSPDELLIKAAENGTMFVVQIALDRGAYIHEENDLALRCAAGNGHLNVVKLLLDNGANVHANDDAALCWATESGHENVVKLLLDNGANIHAVDDWSLHLAVRNGHTDVVKLIKTYKNLYIKLFRNKMNAKLVRESLNELKNNSNNNKQGFFTNIEQDTLDNNDFRRVLYTGEYSQLVLMTLNPNENIGKEVHSNIDQFFRFEQGNGQCIINNNKYNVSDGDCIIIPAGSEHDIINTGKNPLKMYTVYSPANHKDKVVFKTKKDAKESEEKFNRQISE